MSRRKKPLSLFLWHRRLGLITLILIFVLSITGIMLNHTEEFKLDKTIIESDFILNWYDINPQGTPVNYTISDTWVSQWNQQLFFNGKSLLVHQEQLKGIVKIDGIIALALEHFVLLLDDNGEMIELISIGKQFTIKKIGQLENKITLLDVQNDTYISDADFTSWHKQKSLNNQWSKSSQLPENKINILQKSFRGEGLNLERVILDLHSGRIFNANWGVYIMDFSAITMMLLGLSGLWIWWSRKLKIRKKKYYKKHH